MKVLKATWDKIMAQEPVIEEPTPEGDAGAPAAQ